MKAFNEVYMNNFGSLVLHFNRRKLKVSIYISNDKIKIGYFIKTEGFHVLPCMERAVNIAVDYLKKFGHELIEWIPIYLKDIVLDVVQKGMFFGKVEKCSVYINPEIKTYKFIYYCLFIKTDDRYSTVLHMLHYPMFNHPIRVFVDHDVLFSDEANFFVNGEKSCPKVLVWCRLWRSHVLGSFFFNKKVTGELYLKMLQNDLMPQIERIGEGKPYTS
ncbi:hypothetical protein A3Q56_06265, partial [Intoshia linei]